MKNLKTLTTILLSTFLITSCTKTDETTKPFNATIVYLATDTTTHKTEFYATDGTTEKQLTHFGDSSFQVKIRGFKISDDKTEIVFSSNIESKNINYCNLFYAKLDANLNISSLKRLTDLNTHIYAFQSVFSNTNKIYYEYAYLGKTAIYSVNKDGSNNIVLKNTINTNITDYMKPSKNLQKILFEENYNELYISNFDFSNKLKLKKRDTLSLEYYEFSNDNSKVLFSYYNSNGREWYVINSDGTNEKKIFSFVAGYRSIYCILDKSANFVYYINDSNGTINSMNFDGTNKKTIFSIIDKRPSVFAIL
jgi:hypothetical protein